MRTKNTHSNLTVTIQKNLLMTIFNETKPKRNPQDVRVIFNSFEKSNSLSIFRAKISMVKPLFKKAGTMPDLVNIKAADNCVSSFEKKIEEEKKVCTRKISLKSGTETTKHSSSNSTASSNEFIEKLLLHANFNETNNSKENKKLFGFMEVLKNTMEKSIKYLAEIACTIRKMQERPKLWSDHLDISNENINSENIERKTSEFYSELSEGEITSEEEI